MVIYFYYYYYNQQHVLQYFKFLTFLFIIWDKSQISIRRYIILVTYYLLFMNIITCCLVENTIKKTYQRTFKRE